MKFSVNKADLFHCLQKVIGVVPQKTTVPILGNLLLQLNEGKLDIRATDLDISINTQCNVRDAIEGGIAVPGKKLFDIVREIPDLPITVEADERRHLAISTEKGVYKFSGESESEFPQIAVEEAESEFFIDGKKFRRMIEKTVFAVSSDELRTTLMGVYLQLLNNELRMVATDGHRLAKISDFGISHLEAGASVILPVKALQIITKNIEDDDRLHISIGENHITFAIGNTTIFSKLIEGQFPNYERVIPLDNDLMMYVNKDLLTAAVKRVSIFSNQYTHQIKFSVSPSSLLIQTEDMEIGGEAQESIPVDYTGDELEVGYDANYLLDILRHMEKEELAFKLKDEGNAAIITPAEQENDEELMMLLMPIRLGDNI